MAASPVICEAIRQRALLEFHYHGHLRIVAPYCYGVSTRNSDVLRAIQIRGSSSTGNVVRPFGKLWTVADIVGLKRLEETFEPDDPNYNPNDTAMKRIYCRIE